MTTVMGSQVMTIVMGSSSTHDYQYPPYIVIINYYEYLRTTEARLDRRPVELQRRCALLECANVLRALVPARQEPDARVQRGIPWESTSASGASDDCTLYGGGPLYSACDVGYGRDND
jgi:hypothetical protein